VTREPLPHRRYGESFDIQHLGIRYSMQIGCYEDGRVGEVFLGMEKAAGTAMDVNARDMAVVMSMAIQHGVPIERMLKAVTKDSEGRSEGLMGHVLELIAAWKPVRGGWGQTALAKVADVELLTSTAPAPGAAPINKENAKVFGFTGDECTQCHSFQMVRNGTCLKCENCGSTTGCS